jgi:hypothetical protein
MSTVITLFRDKSDTLPPPPITRKAGHTLLEFMQQTRGLPYYTPTVQFRQRGSLFEPVNPLAKSFGKLVGRTHLTDAQLRVIEEMGMALEVRP